MNGSGKRISRSLVLLAAFTLTVAIGIAERFVHPGLSWFVFYLVPLLPAAWFGGFGAGIGVTVLSAAAWTVNVWLAPGLHPAAGTFLWDVQTRIILFVLVSWTLGALGENLRLKRFFAHTDGLTGIGTRLRFFDTAETELSRARRYKHPFTIVLFDIDGLKAVNQTSGHAGGDKLLCALAAVLGTNTRKSDFAARLGNDDFAVWLPETRFLPADRWIARIRQRLSGTAVLDTPAVSVTVAAVTFQALPATVDEVLGLADGVMAEAKSAGRGGERHRAWAAGGLVPEGTEMELAPET